MQAINILGCEDNDSQCWLKNNAVYECAIYYLIMVPIIFAIGWFLWRPKVWLVKPCMQPIQEGTGSPWKIGLFGCLGSPSIFVHAWCCSASRLVDTWITSGVIPRDAHLKWFCIVLCCPNCTCCCVAPWMRSQVKGNLGGPGNIEPLEVIMGWFCFPCTICQEAQEVDQHAGAETSMCCELVDPASKQAIGDAVKVYPDKQGNYGALDQRV